MLIKKNNLPYLAILLLLTLPAWCDDIIFYEERSIGSESLFNPASSYLYYTLDSLQIKNIFSTNNYMDNFSLVRYNLSHPNEQIEEEGGYNRYINAEIIPYDIDLWRESDATLPNYGLHLFGGGLVYRKNAEWFESQGMPYPYFTAGVLAMAAEVLAEPLEKPATDDADEIADVYIFRPLGMWLFSDDKRAQWIKDKLDPVDWPHLLMFDPDRDELFNIGLSYVVRPQLFDSQDTRFFAYLGITTLFGLSHRLDSGDEISWGLGTSTTKIKPAEVRESAGIFWDRNNSLLASLIINGTENLALRANVYPGVLFNKKLPLGLFAGMSDDGDITFGLQLQFPIGLGRDAH